MRIFAIELSSRVGSMALVDGGRVLAESRWEEDFKNRQQLFDALAAMDLDWTGIDAFAIGRGPGAFSGMRIAFSVANALAAPGGQPVYALNSGAALATQCGATRTVVVGDARRGMVWAGCFSGSALEQEFRLLERKAFAAFVPEDAFVASSEHDRLADLLAGFRTAGTSLFPEAGVLGTLVAARLKLGAPAEPFEPLYLHPPVFIEPRFPG